MFQVFATFNSEAVILRKPSTPPVTLNDKPLNDVTLYTAVLEFLRPISLLYHAVTLVPPPEALKDPSVHEFEPLCRYLGFAPSVAGFLTDSCVETLFAS
ncbi:unnamed protein product [Gongylonema pulchrum]|uniref:Uncharacterized protein n=1 Tax=Gongylonema pulchrum TaxID=637853 RepID=A0A183EZ58_9BILA|nr:unnamed protein product [Gongylonema pulchrum]